MTKAIRLFLPILAALTMLAQQPPIRVGGNVIEANIMKKVPPTYPEAMKAQGLEAKVLLAVLIDAQGVPKSISVEDSNGPSDFADAAIQAVKEWRYRPTLLNGQPVEVLTTITVNFTLAK
jgi:protein TonB